MPASPFRHLIPELFLVGACTSPTEPRAVTPATPSLTSIAFTPAAAFASGIHAFKSAGGRITFGPVWDFDLAFGGYSYDFAPEGFKFRSAGYRTRLFTDPASVAQVKARWQLLAARRGELDAWVGEYARVLHLSQQRTHALWHPHRTKPLLVADDPHLDILAGFLTPSRGFGALFTDADYDGEMAALRGWISTRFDRLGSRILAL